LLALGYLEPPQLLEAWGNKVFGLQVFWGLLSRYGLLEGSAVMLKARGIKLLVAGSLGPDFPHRLPRPQISGSAAGLTRENQVYE
jgi:hypothetical protein